MPSISTFPTLTRDEVFRIETRRLWLRWPRLQDAVMLSHWTGRPEVATMTSTFKVDMSEAEIVDRTQSMRASNTVGRSLSFVMVPQGADNHAIGMVGVHTRPDGGLELGYHLDPAHWGLGLMSEAVSALAAQVFELTDAPRIDAAVRPDNHASSRVLEKCGFKPVGAGEHDSPIYGRYLVRNFALPRSKPSALLSAYRRFNTAPAIAHDLVGLV